MRLLIEIRDSGNLNQTTHRNIASLKNGASPGLDGIGVKLIKTMNHHLKMPFNHIINVTFETSEVPVEWKKSLVVYVYSQIICLGFLKNA